ncbi:DMT family transporter [Vibrio gangliei]|uniref:DMT family transporter n=1 Tax=Vibrio gangliei TaxID=2077090 RepID=UPI000D0146A7|nr:DMT family transporter [Vibrio gangliei]
MPSSAKAVIILIFCTFFWGSTFPIGKQALNEVHALTLILWRFLIAAAFLAVYIKLIRSPKIELSNKQWAWVFAVSAVGVGGLNLGLFTGLSYTSATNGSLIMALSPIMTSIIASIAHRSLPSRTQLFSLLVSLSGVLIVITNGQLDLLINLDFNHGDKLIFTGMLAWSLYTFFSQGISKWMPVIPYTLVGMVCGAIVIGTMCALTPDVHPFAELFNSSTRNILDVVYIGLFGTVAGYLLWLNGIRLLGSATASLFFNFVPIFAMLTAFAMGHEISQLQLIGVAVVIAGLVLPRLLTMKKPKQPAQS